MEPEDADIMVPVRDTGDRDRHSRAMFHDRDATLVQERAGINKLSREELEDRHLRLLEQNQVLKKHCHKQEDKIKRLATKLLRLVQDKKRCGEAGRRDPETVELIQSQQDQISVLQRQLAQTKDKLLVARQQVASGGPGTRPGRTAAKADPARRPSSRPSSKTNSLRPQGGPAGSEAPPALPAYAERLLVEAREVASGLQRQTAALTEQNRQLEDRASALRQQCTSCEQELEMQKEQLRIKELEHEEEVESLRNQLNHASRCKLSENVEMIKLQRELKQTGSQLAAAQAHCAHLDDERRKLQPGLERTARELAELRQLHEAEQRRCQQLQRDLVSRAQTEQQLDEVQATLASTQKENDLLRAANERLSEIGDTEQNWQRQAEVLQTQLRAQLASVETTLRCEQSRSRQLADQLSGEQQRSWQLQAEAQQLQQRLLSRPPVAELSLTQPVVLQPQPQLSHPTVSLHQSRPAEPLETADKAVNTESVDEQTGPPERSGGEPAPDTPTAELLRKIDSGEPVSRQLAALHCQYVETVRELEKTRTMLDVQKQINAAQQQEVALLSRRLAELTEAREKQEAELRATLEARNGRVVALERKLRQLVYRDPGAAPAGLLDSSLQLETGSCLLQLHIGSLQLLPAVGAQLAAAGGGEGVFLTWVFFNQDTHYTPVVREMVRGRAEGQAVDTVQFDCSSLYKLTSDRKLLQYLRNDQLTIEAHRTEGESGSRQLGTATISCREMLRYPRNKLHGTVEMAGVGTLSYWYVGDAALERLLRRCSAPAQPHTADAAAAARTPGAVDAEADQSIVAGSPDLCEQPTEPKVGHGPAAVSTPVRRRLAARAAPTTAADKTAAAAPAGAVGSESEAATTPERTPVKERRRPTPTSARRATTTKSEADLLRNQQQRPRPTVRRRTPRRADRLVAPLVSPRGGGGGGGGGGTSARQQPAPAPRRASQTRAAGAEETPRSRRSGVAGPPSAAAEGDGSGRRHVRRTISQPTNTSADPAAAARHQQGGGGGGERRGSPASAAAAVSHSVTTARRVLSAPKTPVAASAGSEGRPATVATPQRQRPPLQTDQVVVGGGTGYATYTESSDSSESAPVEETGRSATSVKQQRSSRDRASGSESASVRSVHCSGGQASPSGRPRSPGHQRGQSPSPHQQRGRSVTTAAADAWGEGATAAAAAAGGSSSGGRTPPAESSRAPPPADDSDSDSDSSGGSSPARPPEDALRVAVEVHRRASAAAAADKPSSGSSSSSSSSSSPGGSPASGTDSEGVVVHRRPALQDLLPSDRITVTIHSVTLSAAAPVYVSADADVLPSIFVEFRLLDVPPEELEAPHSLPLPSPGETLVFNFRKVVDVSISSRRRQLRSLLQSAGDGSAAGGDQLNFCAVAEPPDAADDDDTTECADIGWARLSLSRLLVDGADLREETLPLLAGPESPASAPVGSLVVSVEAVQALRAATRAD